MSAGLDRRLVWFLALLAPVLVWSWIGPHDRFTWWLESAPVVAGVPLILACQRRFPLSSLLLVLLWLHCVILVTGGHYTYARVPLGEWARGWFGWTRNNYDKLGHFAQGFVPAILTRELLARTSPLKGSRWLGFLVVAVCLAFSALYELIEWFTAVTSGAAADDFLGTQGDPWDTQTDMLTALIGAIVAVVGFSRWHDRSMDKVLPEAERSASSSSAPRL
jgi:putative membrane protein